VLDETGSEPEWNWRQLAAAIMLQAVRDAEQARGGQRHEARSFLAAPVAREILVELGMEPAGLVRFRGEPVQLVLDGFG
jgi:hypothetical protein